MEMENIVVDAQEEKVVRITAVKREEKERVKTEIEGLLKQVDRPGIDNLMTYLSESDFYSAPASVNHHANFEGGLAMHTLNVYKVFKRKCENYKLDTPKESIIIAALLHDLCKIDFYKPSTRRKTDEHGKWYSYKSYVYDDKLPLGHGEKSMAVALRYIPLTDEEMCLIRWHMVMGDGAGFGYSENIALKMFPSITLLRTSDMEASALLEACIER